METARVDAHGRYAVFPLQSRAAGGRRHRGGVLLCRVARASAVTHFRHAAALFPACRCPRPEAPPLAHHPPHGSGFALRSQFCRGVASPAFFSWMETHGRRSHALFRLPHRHRLCRHRSEAGRLGQRRRHLYRALQHDGLSPCARLPHPCRAPCRPRLHDRVFHDYGQGLPASPLPPPCLFCHPPLCSPPSREATFRPRPRLLSLARSPCPRHHGDGAHDCRERHCAHPSPWSCRCQCPVLCVTVCHRA